MSSDDNTTATIAVSTTVTQANPTLYPSIYETIVIGLSAGALTVAVLTFFALTLVMWLLLQMRRYVRGKSYKVSNISKDEIVL